jgi:HK97 gp10 family phage protein
MYIKLVGADKLVRKFERIANNADVLIDVISDGTEAIYNSAKALAPVDTGLLRRSIKAEVIKTPNSVSGVVGISLLEVPYAVHQEFGTWKMKAQPYLRPALTKHKATIRRNLNKAIKSITK